jgi:hypothetical protein
MYLLYVNVIGWEISRKRQHYFIFYANLLPYVFIRLKILFYVKWTTVMMSQNTFKFLPYSWLTTYCNTLMYTNYCFLALTFNIVLCFMSILKIIFLNNVILMENIVDITILRHSMNNDHSLARKKSVPWSCHWNGSNLSNEHNSLPKSVFCSWCVFVRLPCHT